MTDIIKEDRPIIIGGLTIKVKTGCGNMYIQMNWCHGRLFEVFATLGKSGGCASCHTEATTRLITSALRSHMPIDECVKQVSGLRCPEPVPFPKDDRVLSCPDAIANTMIKYGKLSVRQVIGLILKANDMAPEDNTLDEEQEAQQAAIELEKLQKKREEDGLYTEEAEQGDTDDNTTRPGPDGQDEPCQKVGE